MRKLTEDAKVRLDKYLDQVRDSLCKCTSIDADEVESDIKAHIETELEGADEPVSLKNLEAILDRLGSPTQWVPEEEISWWRKIILRLRKGPEDWRLAYISFGLLILGFLLGRSTLIIFLPASFIIARAVISETGRNNTKELAGQQWLIYPSLILVYAFAAFWLLLWPMAALGAIAEELESNNFNMFPWNLPDDPNRDAYWSIAIMFMAAGTALWCLILGLVHRIKPRILQFLFRPFAERIKTKWANSFISITVGLLILSLTLGFLMTQYHGWYYFLKKFTE